MLSSEYFQLINQLAVFEKTFDSVSLNSSLEFNDTKYSNITK